MFDNVVGTLAYAIVTGVRDPRAPELGLRIAGVVPGVGESHFVSPSDCFGRPCRGAAFDARGPAESDDREQTRAESAAEWRELKCEWPSGNKSGVARWVPVCVVRMSLGGEGGGRFLSMTPEPAP